MTLIVTILGIVLSWPLGYLGAAMRRDLPGTGWLDRVPWPGSRKTGKDSPCTTAASTASTTSTTRRTRNHAKTAATTARHSRTTSVLDALTAPLRMRQPTGQHSAAALGLAFDANRGQWRHAETGPITIPDNWGAVPAGRTRGQQ